MENKNDSNIEKLSSQNDNLIPTKKKFTGLLIALAVILCILVLAAVFIYLRTLFVSVSPNKDQASQASPNLTVGLPKLKLPNTLKPAESNLVNSGVQLADYVTNKIQQVGTDGKLYYIIGGSGGTSIYAKAKNFTEITIDSSGKIVEGNTREINDVARSALEKSTRQIGDLDYMPVNSNFSPSGVSQKMSTGGDLISYFSPDEIPQSARSVLRDPTTGLELHDLSELAGSSSSNIKGAKVTVDGKDYYLVRPDQMLSEKTMDAIQRYYFDPEKFNADLKYFPDAVREMGYNEEGILADTNRRIDTFRKDFWNGDSIVDNHIGEILDDRQAPTELKGWLEKFKSPSDPFWEGYPGAIETQPRSLLGNDSSILSEPVVQSEGSSTLSTIGSTVSGLIYNTGVLGKEMVASSESTDYKFGGIDFGNIALNTSNVAMLAPDFFAIATPGAVAGLSPAAAGYLTGAGPAGIIAGGALAWTNIIKNEIQDQQTSDALKFLWQDTKDAFIWAKDGLLNTKSSPDTEGFKKQTLIITDDPGSFVQQNEKVAAESYNQSLERFKQAERDYSNALKEYDNGNLSEQKLSEARENFRSVGSKYEEESQKYDADTKVTEAYMAGKISDTQAEDLQNQIASGEVTPGQTDSQLASLQSQQTAEQSTNGETRVFSPDKSGELRDQYGNLAPEMYASNSESATDARGGSGTADATPQKGVFERMTDYVADIPQRVAKTFGFKDPEGPATDFSGNPKTHEEILKAAETGVDTKDTTGKPISFDGSQSSETPLGDQNLTDVNSTPSDLSFPVAEMPNMFGGKSENKEPQGFWESTKNSINSTLSDVWSKITGEPAPEKPLEDRVITLNDTVGYDSMPDASKKSAGIPNNPEGDNVLYPGDPNYVNYKSETDAEMQKIDRGVSQLGQFQYGVDPDTKIETNEDGSLSLTRNNSMVNLGNFSEREKQELLDKYQQKITDDQQAQTEIENKIKELSSGSRMDEPETTPSWWQQVEDTLYGRTDESGQRIADTPGDRTEKPVPGSDFWGEPGNKLSSWPFSPESTPVPDNITNSPLPPIPDNQYQQPAPTPMPEINREILAEGNGTAGSSYKLKNTKEAEDMLDRIFEIDPETGEVKLKEGFEKDKDVQKLKGNIEFDKEKVVDAKIKKGKIDKDDKGKYLKDNKITVPDGTTVQDDKNRNYTADENPDKNNPSETSDEIDTKKVKIVND